MKMKKFLSVILASLVITAAGCSGSGDSAATTTTTADNAVTTTEATEATTEAATTTTAAETTPADSTDNPLMTEEVEEFISAVKAEAPIYGSFLEKTYSVPVTIALTQEMDLFGTGEMSTVYLEMGMASFESFYVSTNSLGSPMDIIFNDGKYYMVSAEEKTALYMEMSDAEAAEMSETMTASVKASFDPSSAEFETGETEYNGSTYLYEKITADETGEIMVYADPATKEIKYLVNQGMTMEITYISSEVDPAKLTVPSDYTLIDMADMMGGSDDSTDSSTPTADAATSAASYLEYSAFSYNGLVEQLEFEGYSHEEAVAAVDACGADWDEQATKCAASHLEYSAFSYTGLVEQLEYDGFTPEQAKKAVDACGADWDEQAAKCAATYLEYNAFSYIGLVEQLGYDGFTPEQAKTAVDNYGADWKEQAARSAKEYIDYFEFGREKVIEQLEFDGFTSEEAAYGADANGL